MPDQLENVRVVFDAETASLQEAADVYKEIIGEDQALVDQVKKSNAAMQQQGKDMSTLLTGNKKSIDELSKSFQNLDKNIVGGTYKKVLGDIRKELQLTDAQAKTFYKNLIKNSQQQIVSAQTTEELQNLQELLAAATQELKEMGGAEEQVEEKTLSLKAQLRQMKEELTNIDDPSDPRFIQLSREAAELEDRIGDTREQVRLLSSDTRYIDATIQAVSGLAGAFAVAQGAAALFGSENEDLQRALLKVNAAMSILQGLQQIQALVDKNSALNILLINSLRTKQAESTVAVTVAEEANTAATVANTTATESATVATAELNSVMAANPAALLLLSITALVSIMVAFTSSTNDAADAQERLNNELDRNKKVSDDLQSTLAQEDKERLAQLKASGATEKQLRDEELKLAQERFNIRRADLEKTVQEGKKANAQLKELAKNNFETEQHYTEVGTDGIARDRVKRIKVDEAFLDALDKTAKEGLAAQKELNTTASELRIQDYENQVATNKDLLDNQKEADEKSKRIAEANAQAIFNIRQRALQATADFYDKVANDPSFGSQIQLDALQKSLEAQKDLINLEKNFELSKEGLTATQKLDITDKFNNELAKITQTGYDQRNQIIANANAAQIAGDQAYYNQLIVEHQKNIDKINKSVDDQFSKIGFNNSNEEVARLAALDNAYKEGLVTYQQFLQKRDDISKDYAKRDLNNEIASLQAKISNMQALGEDTTALQDQLNAKLKQKYDQDAQNYTDAEKKKQDAVALRQQIEEAAIQVVSQLASAFFQGQQAKYQQEEQQVQELADKKLITEKEAQKRINQLRRNEAAINKAEALFNIAINTAVAAAKAASQTGVGASVAIPIVEAIGLALAALVNSKQLPQYKKGGYTGDAGVDEVAGITHGREFVAHAEATKRYRPALEAMHNLKFEEYLGKYAQTAALAQSPNISLPIYPDSIDYDKVGEAFAKHVGKISDMPQSGLSFDENGIKLWVKRNDQLDIYLNKKYKYKSN